MIIHPCLNFEPFISQGDHGRDLYSFKRTFEGDVPYKDYWWQYGPFMPYYYSLFFHIFGISIQSVLYGKHFLVFAIGLLMYFGLISFLSPVFAALTAVYYWVYRPDFFYTFNHIGGIFFIIFVLYCLLRLLKTNRKIYFWLALSGSVFLSMVRLNLGISTLAAFFTALFLRDIFYDKSHAKTKIKHYIKWFFISVLVIGGIYGLFFWGVSLSDIKKCLPYSGSYLYDNAPINRIVQPIFRVIIFNFTANWARKVFSLILLVSGARLVFLISRNKISEAECREELFPLLAISIFLLFNLHESFISVSIYRLFWVYPLVVLFLLSFIGVTAKYLNAVARAGILIILAYFVLTGGYENYKEIVFYKKPVNLLSVGENQVYLANQQWGEYTGDTGRNERELLAWKNTVLQTTEYVKENTQKGEEILVLPYDPLYYFLSERPSASYYLAFFDFIHISSGEEQKLIDHLEKKNVRYILLSNRAYSLQPHLGVIGRDYCPWLTNYISDKFEIVASFGNWTEPPSFLDHHGVRIFRRK